MEEFKIYIDANIRDKLNKEVREKFPYIDIYNGKLLNIHGNEQLEEICEYMKSLLPDKQKRNIPVFIETIDGCNYEFYINIDSNIQDTIIRYF